MATSPELLGVLASLPASSRNGRRASAGAKVELGSGSADGVVRRTSARAAERACHLSPPDDSRSVDASGTAEATFKGLSDAYQKIM